MATLNGSSEPETRAAPDFWSAYLAGYHTRAPRHHRAGPGQRPPSPASARPTSGCAQYCRQSRDTSSTSPAAARRCNHCSRMRPPTSASTSPRTRRALAARAGRGPLLHADALRLPLADTDVDAVVCSMAIMLLRPAERALAEIARVLRPGGILATIRPVGTPVSLGDLRLVLPLLAGLRHLPEMPQRFSGHRFQRLVSNAGMTIVADEALRFTHPLESPADASLAVEALYLPHVSAERRRDATRRLTRRIRPRAQIPWPSGARWRCGCRTSPLRMSDLEVASAPSGCER